MTIKIRGLAIKRFPYNAVARETLNGSLGETSHCDAWRDRQTNRWTINKIIFSDNTFYCPKRNKSFPFSIKPSFSYKIILQWGGGLRIQS
jgi:hypothetical protein